MCCWESEMGLCCLRDVVVREPTGVPSCYWIIRRSEMSGVTRPLIAFTPILYWLTITPVTLWQTWRQSVLIPTRGRKQTTDELHPVTNRRYLYSGLSVSNSTQKCQQTMRFISEQVQTNKQTTISERASSGGCPLKGQIWLKRRCM